MVFFSEKVSFPLWALFAFALSLPGCRSSETVQPVGAVTPAPAATQGLREEEDHDHDNVSLEICENLVGKIGQSLDTDQMGACIDWYWHNLGDDIGYNKIIKLGYRIVEIEPQSSTVYTTVAWLLWSKWVTWKDHPEEMPDGEKKAEEAVNLLVRGRLANPHDGAYHKDCADTIAPLARHHLPQYWTFVIESYRLAELYPANQEMLVMVRNSIGHSYRLQLKWEEAVDAYASALKVDPDYRPALMNYGLSLRMLRRFSESIAAYNRVLDKKWNYSFAYIGIGDVYFDMGQIKDAAKNYIMGSDLDPDNLDHAVSLRKVFKFTEASVIYERALRKNAKNIRALIGRAHILRETEKRVEAIAAYEAVLALLPQNAEAIWYLKELKKFGELPVSQFPGKTDGDQPEELGGKPRLRSRTN